jgi:hypothetical protein
MEKPGRPGRHLLPQLADLTNEKVCEALNRWNEEVWPDSKNTERIHNSLSHLGNNAVNEGRPGQAERHIH